MKTRNLVTGGASLALAGFVCTVLAFAQSQATGGRRAASISPQGCVNIFAREPLLTYDVTGSTLVGPSHMHLSVYSDGVASFSQFEATDPDGPLAMVRSLPVEVVQELAGSLKIVNGEGICDEPSVVSDAPLVTVTLFSLGETDDASHTFSYYQVPGGPAMIVEELVQDFIEAEFVGHR